jgi:hypothetical protein
LESQRVRLRLCELKHEVLWKAVRVALDGLVEVESLDLVEFGQVGIEHDLLAADEVD